MIAARPPPIALPYASPTLVVSPDGSCSHREQARHAAALGVLGAHEMAGALRRDHEDVHVGGRLDEFEMDIEAVAEGQVLALGEMRRDLGLVNLGAHLVGHQHHDHVGALGGFGGIEYRQALLGGLLARRRFRAEPDAYVHPAVAQVERMRMSLASEANDRDLFTLERGQVRVAVVINLHLNVLPNFLAVRLFSFARPAALMIVVIELDRARHRDFS